MLSELQFLRKLLLLPFRAIIIVEVFLLEFNPLPLGVALKINVSPYIRAIECLVVLIVAGSAVLSHRCIACRWGIMARFCNVVESDEASPIITCSPYSYPIGAALPGTPSADPSQYLPVAEAALSRALSWGSCWLGTMDASPTEAGCPKGVEVASAGRCGNSSTITLHRMGVCCHLCRVVRMGGSMLGTTVLEPYPQIVYSLLVSASTTR